MITPDYTNENTIQASPDTKLTADKLTRIETIFVWIDILGFSDKLENECDYKKLNDILFSFHNHFVDETGKYEVTSISDGMVCELNPRREKWGINDVRDCFKKIAEKQASFIAKYRYLIRGGISVGTKLFDLDVKGFIGNGLSRANKTESKSISWPIIGFLWCDKLEQKLEDLYHAKDIPKALDLKFTKNERDEDVYFLDYKKWLKGTGEDIKELVSEELSNNKNPLRVKMKYEWTKQYLEMDDINEKVFVIK